MTLDPAGYPLPASYSRRARRAGRRWPRAFCCLGCLAPLMACLFAFLFAVLISGPMNVLVLGMDARPGQGYLTRTDSIILANVRPSSLGVTLLSIPRDVFIRVPGYGDQRINTINMLGEQDAPGSGPQLLKESFKESFGVDVDHYIRLDFDGFRDLVNAVGGVDIDVPKLIVDYEYPMPDGGYAEIRFEPGRQHMDGERALQYARTRHQDDDYQRAGRQQQVVDALVKKLASPLTIVRWPAVAYALYSHTDTDLNPWDFARMGTGLILGWPGHEQRVLQREDLVGMAGGYAVPNYEALNPWIAERFE